MKVNRVKHVGIAVRDLDSAVARYEQLFGLTAQARRRSDSEQMQAATFNLGEVEIELMEPLAEDSPVGRFIARRGEGMHHIAYEVEDVAAALEAARGAGLETVDERPRQGLDGTRVGFIHPSSLDGVLTELVERD